MASEAIDDVQGIAPDGGAPDRAPDWVAGGTPSALRSSLAAELGEDRLATRAIDLVRYASDASPYRSIPRAVALPRDLDDVRALLRVARSTGTPLVFRAGGTSLSGQAQTDGILADVRRHWQGIHIEDGGASVRAQPGVVLGQLNRRLRRYGRRMGPDPASTDIACVGGVLANNSGGMRCGVRADSYRTVRSLTFVLPDGTTIDTAAPGTSAAFAEQAPRLAGGLAQLRDELRSDAQLAERVRRKFEIKNTTGYRLCAFLDADEPLEIFRRLLIGSEGTLAFVAEASFETIPLERHTTTSLALFADIDAAVAAVGELVAAGASATELMVAPTLIAAAWNMPGTPESWKELPPQAAALLIEFRAEEVAALEDPERAGLEILAAHQPLQAAAFTRDAAETAMLWRVREGMQGLLAAIRAPGVTMIIEDICVPPPRIGEAAKDLQALLSEHGFLPGVAGHASAGNLHFLLTPNFGDRSDLERYEAFMGALVDLVVDKYDGSLKAEHGTGVNMAPYVEREWGAKATEMMWRLKDLADPDGVLAPGVMLTREPGSHLRNLKSAPEISPIATQCIECGFCEPVCPSRDLSTTPRQRIAIERELARQLNGSAVADALREQSRYEVVQTCAADGTCSLSCPVGIDTGKLVKEMRADAHSQRARRAALRAAERWGLVERGARAALRAGLLAEGVPMRALTAVARAAVEHELVPAWGEAMPAPAPRALPQGARDRATAAAVYFPACVNRIFGSAPEDPAGPWVVQALCDLSARAGKPLWIPDDVAGRCCATPWSSKGYPEGHAHMARHMAQSILRWTDDGSTTLVVDATSCTHALLGELPAALDDALRERLAAVPIVDSIEWVHDTLLPALRPTRKVQSVAVHAPCAAQHLGLTGKLEGIAQALAEEVFTPTLATCCGAGGDRGLLHPELPQAALAPLVDELGTRALDACLCSNRTCEIGLQEVTGRPYGSFVLLAEELTRGEPR